MLEIRGSTPRRPFARNRRARTKYRPKTMSWKDKAKQAEQDDRQAIGTGPMRSGDTLTLTFQDEGETFESAEYGEGVRFDVKYVEGDARHESDDGEAYEAGDELRLITWSSRLLGALAGYDLLTGKTLEIKRQGEGYDTQYTVVEADE